MTAADQIERVAIVMAMRAEARHVLEQLNAEPRMVASGDQPGLPFEWYEAKTNGLDVLVAVNGKDPRHGCDSVGTQPAALNTYAAITDHRPDLVITAGTAGGFARHDTEIGDVFLSEERFVFHDRRIPMEPFTEYGIGSYPAMPAGRLAAELGYKTGIVSSSDSLDESDPCRLAMLETGAKVKEMEAAAVAWVCDLLGVPLLAIKTITDLVDHPEDVAEQFVANLQAATRQLAVSVPAVLDAIEGRSVASLGA